MKHHPRDKAYEYTITFMKYGKIKTMTMEAESREDALLLFQSRIEEMGQELLACTATIEKATAPQPQ